MADNDTAMLRVIHKFLTDEAFRCQALYRERTTLRDLEHLSTRQIDALLSLDPDKVWDQLKEDLKAAEQAMRDRHDEMHGPIVPASKRTAAAVLFAASGSFLYGEGDVHLRTVDPEEVSTDGSYTFELRGQGFAPLPNVQIRFRNTTSNAEVLVAPTHSSCDPDILQRVTVEVSGELLTEGEWEISARNNALEAWSKDNVTITVTA